MSDDLKILEHSKSMLEGFQKKLKSHLDNDQSASNFSQYFTDTDAYSTNKIQTKPKNVFKETRSLSEQMRRRFLTRQKDASLRPQSIATNEEDIIKKIVDTNRVYIPSASIQDLGYSQVVKKSLPYSVSKQIAQEKIMYEKRIEEYRDIMRKQEEEIKTLQKELEIAMRNSSIKDEYSLPDSLEEKLKSIRRKGDSKIILTSEDSIRNENETGSKRNQKKSLRNLSQKSSKNTMKTDSIIDKELKKDRKKSTSRNRTSGGFAIENTVKKDEKSIGRSNSKSNLINSRQKTDGLKRNGSQIKGQGTQENIKNGFNANFPIHSLISGTNLSTINTYKPPLRQKTTSKSRSKSKVSKVNQRNQPIPASKKQNVDSKLLNPILNLINSFN